MAWSAGMSYVYDRVSHTRERQRTATLSDSLLYRLVRSSTARAKRCSWQYTCGRHLRLWRAGSRRVGTGTALHGRRASSHGVPRLYPDTLGVLISSLRGRHPCVDYQAVVPHPSLWRSHLGRPTDYLRGKTHASRLLGPASDTYTPHHYSPCTILAPLALHWPVSPNSKSEPLTERPRGIQAFVRSSCGHAVVSSSG